MFSIIIIFSIIGLTGLGASVVSMFLFDKPILSLWGLILSAILLIGATELFKDLNKKTVNQIEEVLESSKTKSTFNGMGFVVTKVSGDSTVVSCGDNLYLTGKNFTYAVGDSIFIPLNQLVNK